jgi:hypothetical protein
MHGAQLIRKRLKLIYLNRLRNNHCKPWRLDDLFLQRSIIRYNMSKLGSQLSKHLSNEWALSIVKSWPKPKIFNDQVCDNLIAQFEKYDLHEASTVVRNLKEMYIPLDFWYNHEARLSLPLCHYNIYSLW